MPSRSQACEALEAVLAAAEPRRGGAVGYTAYHVARALEALHGGPHGRPRLVRLLGIGEAGAKTLLSRLQARGLVERAGGGRGYVLTTRGEAVLRALRGTVTVYRPRLDVLEEPAAIVSPLVEPPRDLTGVYSVRDYLVAMGCRTCLVGGVEAGVPRYPGVPQPIHGVLEAWDPGVPRGLVVIVPSRCLPRAYHAVLRLVADRACGVTGPHAR